MAGRDPYQDSSRQRCLTKHGFAGGNCRQRPGGRNPECRHGFAYNVLAQDRTNRCSAVAPAREGRWSGPLELNVVTDAVTTNYLSQQIGPSVSELRHEMSILVSGIGLREGLGTRRHKVAGQDIDAFFTLQRNWIQPKLPSQL